MQINHATQGKLSAPDVRGGGKQFNTLLVGREGSPGNYRFVLTRQTTSVYTPRHRHNFDQLRLCLSGRINYGPECWIEPGQIAYFPEGTPYGPEESDVERFGVTIQFGGASGAGFLSEAQVHAGMEEMKQFGVFEKGIFRRTDAQPGERRNQDAFEAVWEHANRRKLEYPQQRYDHPILMKPEHFEWQSDLPGIARKALGTFSERRLEVEQMRIDAGVAATIVARAGSEQLCFVMSGTGAVNGQELHLHTAFALEGGGRADVHASEEVVLLLIGLPVFAN